MTAEIALVFVVLGVIVLLFVTEALRVDVIAICAMVVLAWLGLVTPAEAFSGLASNAVVSIMGVMILGHGIDRTGVMRLITRPILRAAGTSETKIIALVSGVVGLISAFLQNIGAAALFLPAMMRIAKRSRLSISRLLMPMGFAAILGGTLTMVGSGPLIILNDLLRQGGLAPYGLFDVTPLGLALLGVGIVYFLVAGRFVLPVSAGTEAPRSKQQELIEAWELPSTVVEARVPASSPLVGKTRETAAVRRDYGISLLAVSQGEEILYAPWRHTRFEAGERLALLGADADIDRLVAERGVEREEESKSFDRLRRSGESGFAEVVILPRADIVGQSIRQIALRRQYGVEPLILLSSGGQERSDFSDQPLEAGHTMVVHGLWENVRRVGQDPNFAVVTPIEAEESDRSKARLAVLCLLGSLVLVFLGAKLSLALLTGALSMILLRVVPIDDAYRAIDWRTIFLLAGLIPLGIAMDNSGAARFVAEKMVVLQAAHPLVLMTALALLTTLFSLFMSNVAATVLLVPLVVTMAQMADIDGRVLGLLVAVCASNSFILPTHQVNALLMAPGGYRNADYMRSGGIMSVLFIFVAVLMAYVFYM